MIPRAPHPRGRKAGDLRATRVTGIQGGNTVGRKDKDRDNNNNSTSLGHPLFRPSTGNRGKLVVGTLVPWVDIPTEKEIEVIPCLLITEVSTSRCLERKHMEATPLWSIQYPG